MWLHALKIATAWQSTWASRLERTGAMAQWHARTRRRLVEVGGPLDYFSFNYLALLCDKWALKLESFHPVGLSWICLPPTGLRKRWCGDKKGPLTAIFTCQISFRLLNIADTANGTCWVWSWPGWAPKLMFAVSSNAKTKRVLVCLCISSVHLPTSFT